MFIRYCYDSVDEIQKKVA